MTDANSGYLRLLALVPHRDVRAALRAWSASLFSAGLPGAWSFPRVIPLAALNRPLSDAELKSRALMLRQTVNLSGGKFIAGPPAVAALSANVSVFGPALNITLPDGFFDFEDDAPVTAGAPTPAGVVIRRVPQPVIGSALCDAASPPCNNRPAPPVSFRAAALANMTFRPLFSHNEAENNYSFEWEIGKLFWLPAPKKIMRRSG